MEINRDHYLKQLTDRLQNGMIKVITGLRRSGKSYLLNHIFYQYLKSAGVNDEHIVMLQFDTEESEHLLDRHVLGEHIRSRITDDEWYYLLLDEIQYVEGFEKVLNSLLRRGNIDIYVTGSNSRFLSSDIITEFRGRGDEIHLLPLSFSEFYSVDPRNENEAWAEYMVYGGLPYILNRKTEEQKSEYLKNLFKETYMKDILDHNRMKGVSEMEELIDILASSVGSLANPSRIANTFESVKKVKIAKETVGNYIDYLEDAFLISETKRYDVKGRRYIDTPLKYYFEDIGLRNARLNFRQLEEPHLMENVIYNELRYRGYNIDIGVVEINEKKEDRYQRKQLEIDFIANKGSKKYYIQVALGLSDPTKREQEIKSLKNVRDGFKKVLIRKDNSITFTDEDGILNLYLFDFLLNRKTLDD